MNDYKNLRILAVALCLGVAVAGGVQTLPRPAAEYSGPMKAVNEAAAAMLPSDRAVLAEAFLASSEMLASDSLGIVSNTEEFQRYVQACLEFSYIGVGEPSKKYPAVAKAILAELKKTAGDEVTPLTPEGRGTAAAALAAVASAVR
jgi:hypothetical protein